MILSCTSSDMLNLAMDIVNLMSRLFLPFLLMLFMNIFLVRSLFASKSRILYKNSHNKSSSSTTSTSSSSVVVSASSLSSPVNKRREYTYMLTVISLNWIFFLFNMPWASWYIISHIAQVDANLQTQYASAVLNLLLAISHCIFYLNNMSSFVLNVVFNRLFRRRVLSHFRRSDPLEQTNSTSKLIKSKKKTKKT